MTIHDESTDLGPSGRRQWARVAEILALATGACVLAGSALLPKGVLVVPGLITAHDIALCLSVLVIFSVAVRWLWAWLRWKSILLLLPLAGGALIILIFPASSLWERTFETQSEGFLYDAGFMCPTNVGVVLQCRDSASVIYVLETSCLDTDPERRAFKARRGDFFMRALPEVPDAVMALPRSFAKGSTIIAGC